MSPEYGRVIDIGAPNARRESAPPPKPKPEPQLAYLPDPPSESRGQVLGAAPVESVVRAGKVALKWALVGAGAIGLGAFLGGWWVGRRGGINACKLKKSRGMFE